MEYAARLGEGVVHDDFAPASLLASAQLGGGHLPNFSSSGVPVEYVGHQMRWKAKSSPDMRRGVVSPMSVVGELIVRLGAAIPLRYRSAEQGLVSPPAKGMSKARRREAWKERGCSTLAHGGAAARSSGGSSV